MQRVFAILTNKLKHRFSRTLRQCPICGWRGTRFAPGGPPEKRRYDSRCPRCGSVERHRLAYLVANEQCQLNFVQVLHVAPEKELAKWLQAKAGHYLSIDLYTPAMAKMDITQLELADDSQTLVWASHVLEHVVDDHKAIAELYRVLVSGGTAVIQVPIWRTTTLEDFSKTSPAERQALFHQADHVRLYGLDIVERFAAAGFSAAIHRAQDFGPERLLQHGLSFASTNEVFVFQK